MSSVGYDLDTSGGLMPLIRALIKPPDEDANAQKQKKSQHPYYKRPGKGHNHDSCDACGEGGDLICCDRCPASFHLGCYDPPLEENDIPAGQWLCKECHGAEVDKPSSSRSSRAHSPADSKSDSERRTRSLRNKRESSTVKKNKEEQIKEESKEASEDSAPSEKEPAKKAEEKELTPMEVLVKAARIMNPKQFELPREMMVPCPFPGTDKDPSKNGSNGVTSIDHWGCVPLPAKSCFVCRGTCRAAPLLQCDYCPLLFHQDCLDPPLTALPTGRWMCPNHVEQYIDWKLVNSISATERVALWDKFSGPVDQQEIKVDFIRRARRHYPLFRMKLPVGVRGRVCVPPMVRHHYKHPPPLLPSRREHLRCRRALKRLRESGEYDEPDDEPERKHPICMNLDCPQYHERDGKCPHADRSRDNTALKGVSAEDARRDLRAIAVDAEDAASGSGSGSGSDDSDDLDGPVCPVKRRRTEEGEDKKKPIPASDKLELRACGDETEQLLAAAEEQLERLDERLVKLLAWQRLQQVLAGARCGGAWARAPLSGPAQRAVLRSVDRARLARHGYRHVQLPSQLLSREDQERIARRVWGVPPVPAPAPSPPAPGAALGDVCVRAALLPVQRPASSGLGDGLGRPIPMRLSRLSLGGAACDVRLPHCERASPRHATIFYDEVTRHFELINYSEWGTLVNGVLYTCDVTAAPAPPAGPPELHRDTRPHSLCGGVTRAASPPPCRCRGSPAPPPGGAWEGSALLPHGALLQLGCAQFVFSITDAEGFPYETHVEEPAL